MTVFCCSCSAEVEVADAMISLARCACGSRCFRWDDNAYTYAARPRALPTPAAAAA